ncbi:MAG: hypothetical protein INF43_01115 [Alphaproteobacteria bacterium]|jgi:hypothetical protein|nr:hypothetical protein [Alphaproteobacteria bacterium]
MLQALNLLAVVGVVVALCLLFFRSGVGSFYATLPPGSWLGSKGGHNLKWRRHPPR